MDEIDLLTIFEALDLPESRRSDVLQKRAALIEKRNAARIRWERELTEHQGRITEEIHRMWSLLPWWRRATINRERDYPSHDIVVEAIEHVFAAEALSRGIKA